MHISGLYTITWWYFEAAADSVTTYGDILQRTQHVSLSLRGVILRSEFCEFRTCATGLSQTRWLKLAKNHRAGGSRSEASGGCFAGFTMILLTRIPSNGLESNRANTT